jgi:hypothetical protein
MAAQVSAREAVARRALASTKCKQIQTAVELMELWEFVDDCG